MLTFTPKQAQGYHPPVAPTTCCGMELAINNMNTANGELYVNV